MKTSLTRNRIKESWTGCFFDRILLASPYLSAKDLSKNLLLYGYTFLLPERKTHFLGNGSFLRYWMKEPCNFQVTLETKVLTLKQNASTVKHSDRIAPLRRRSNGRISKFQVYRPEKTRSNCLSYRMYFDGVGALLLFDAFSTLWFWTILRSWEYIDKVRCCIERMWNIRFLPVLRGMTAGRVVDISSNIRFDAVCSLTHRGPYRVKYLTS